MNILFMPTTQMLGMIEGAGGLFDFNGTLPLMAMQFILLTIILTFVFYKPVAKVIDEREAYITENLTSASNSLIEAEELYREYDEKLKIARACAQTIVDKSEREAKQETARVMEACTRMENEKVSEANKKLKSQKTLALKELESQIKELSKLIEEKVKGPIV